MDKELFKELIEVAEETHQHLYTTELRVAVIAGYAAVRAAQVHAKALTEAGREDA